MFVSYEAGCVAEVLLVLPRAGLVSTSSVCSKQGSKNTVLYVDHFAMPQGLKMHAVLGNYCITCSLKSTTQPRASVPVWVWVLAPVRYTVGRHGSASRNTHLRSFEYSIVYM
jgi:hypothetical protein